MVEISLLESLMRAIPFRDKQLTLLHSLLISNPNLSYPLIHLYGLSGTGKTYTVKKFMEQFCMVGGESTTDDGRRRVCVYLNCNELCYATKSLLFNEILAQVKNNLSLTAEESMIDENDEVDICYNADQLAELEREVNGSGGREDDNDDDDDQIDISSNGTINDCSMFLRHLRSMLNARSLQTSLFLIFDNADRLKYLGNDASSLILTLSKLNEYLNPGVARADPNDCQVRTSCVFISEFDWHSLISEWDIMSKTEMPRPYPIFFSDYTRDEMSMILAKTAISFNQMASSSSSTQISQRHADNLKFYSRIILEVFYPICKDLNEIQYLIQIYYDQLLSAAAAAAENGLDSKGDQMMVAWNRMKPFLKQALTQIYLRQSMHNQIKTSTSSSEEPTNLSNEFENLNIAETKQPARTSSDQSCNQLPRIMKFMLISAYIATHNPAKYDRKLFDLGKTTGRKSRAFTAQRFQQFEDNQHAAALKTQAFDLNRFMAIFFAICSENLAANYSSSINLSQVMLNLRTLKSMHYLQQSNSTYSSLDEPKYKCLIDFDTILGLANNVQFNIKQYLAEYINL